MQDLWKVRIESGGTRKQLGWDDEVLKGIKKKWHDFCDSLPDVCKLSMQRWLRFTERSRVELYVFGDASIKAFAVYICTREVGESTPHFVAAKTKVAPL